MALETLISHSSLAERTLAACLQLYPSASGSALGGCSRYADMEHAQGLAVPMASVPGMPIALCVRPRERRCPVAEAELFPVRHPELGLYLCDFNDALVKDDLASMEHPIFALAKGEMKPRRYQNGAHFFEIKPSNKGLPTIWDKDILIFVISQMIAAREAGTPLSRDVTFSAKDMLIFTNRQTGGAQYDFLKDALERLTGALLVTNVKTGDEETYEYFHILDKAKIRRKSLDGRVIEWGVTLSDWLYRAIEHTEVLTLNPDYFRLKRSLERRLYEIVRKHCGRQTSWKVSLDKLYLKSGSRDTKRKFRLYINNLSEKGHLPDYDVTLDDDDMVVFYNRCPEAAHVNTGKRKAMQAFREQRGLNPEARGGSANPEAKGKAKSKHSPKKSTQAPPQTAPKQDDLFTSSSAYRRAELDGETLEIARSMAPGWDIYAAVSDWHLWNEERGASQPKNPDAAFLGFLSSWVKQRGTLPGYE